MRILDPACGSGNFLYVALKAMLDLEKEVSIYAANNGLPRIIVQIDPSQLYGIEVNTYAQQLASVVVWIGYLQWLHDNGWSMPTPPILKALDNIHLQDAVLGRDPQGRLVDPAWPEADYIIGNPPFLGGQLMRNRLGGDYVDALRQLFKGRIPGQSDLVCYWFERARMIVERNHSVRVGLLATQGIRGGSNRRVLEIIKQVGDIFWAISDQEWQQDDVAVHVSMVGFDAGQESNRVLDGRGVIFINADLTEGVDVTQAVPLPENRGVAFQGPVKVGPFDIPNDVAEVMLAHPNPRRIPNSDVVVPWANGADITGRPRGMYIINFSEKSMAEAAQYEAPFEYVRRVVKPVRDNNNEVQRRTNWWRLGRSGIDLRDARVGKARIILTPRVGKHRIFVWAPPELLPDSALVAFARDDDYAFGVLQSKVHEVWARRAGTQLREAESGFRYTPRTCV